MEMKKLLQNAFTALSIATGALPSAAIAQSQPNANHLLNEGIDDLFKNIFNRDTVGIIRSYDANSIRSRRERKNAAQYQNALSTYFNGRHRGLGLQDQLTFKQCLLANTITTLNIIAFDEGRNLKVRRYAAAVHDDINDDYAYLERLRPLGDLRDGRCAKFYSKLGIN